MEDNNNNFAVITGSSTQHKRMLYNESASKRFGVGINMGIQSNPEKQRLQHLEEDEEAVRRFREFQEARAQEQIEENRLKLIKSAEKLLLDKINKENSTFYPLGKSYGAGKELHDAFFKSKTHVMHEGKMTRTGITQSDNSLTAVYLNRKDAVKAMLAIALKNDWDEITIKEADYKLKKLLIKEAKKVGIEVVDTFSLGKKAEIEGVSSAPENAEVEPNDIDNSTNAPNSKGENLEQIGPEAPEAPEVPEVPEANTIENDSAGDLASPEYQEHILTEAITIDLQNVQPETVSQWVDEPGLCSYEEDLSYPTSYIVPEGTNIDDIKSPGLRDLVAEQLTNQKPKKERTNEQALSPAM